MFSTIDIQVLTSLNNFANSSSFWYAFAYFCSSYLIYIIVILSCIFIISIKPIKGDGKYSDRLRVLVTAVLSVILGLAIGFLIEGFVGRERPFIHFGGISTIGGLPGNTSFPSMHTIISFAFAMSITLHHRWHAAGYLMLFLAFMIALGRVMAGMHYPSDILGGMVIGSAAAFVLVYEGSPLFKWISKGSANS